VAATKQNFQVNKSNDRKTDLQKLDESYIFKLVNLHTLKMYLYERLISCTRLLMLEAFTAYDVDSLAKLIQGAAEKRAIIKSIILTKYGV